MRVVANARTAWRWFSMQMAAAGIAVQGAAMAFPNLKEWLGDKIVHVAGLLILVGIVAGRLVDQSKPKGTNNDHPDH